MFPVKVTVHTKMHVVALGITVGKNHNIWVDSDVFIAVQLHEICSFPCNVSCCLSSDTFFQNSILFPPLSLPCLSREAICTFFYSMVLPCCPVVSLTHSYLNVWKTCKQKLHLKTVGANDNLAYLNTKNMTLMAFYWLRKSCFFVTYDPRDVLVQIFLRSLKTSLFNFCLSYSPKCFLCLATFFILCCLFLEYQILEKWEFLRNFFISPFSITTSWELHHCNERVKY